MTTTVQRWMRGGCWLLAGLSALGLCPSARPAAADDMLSTITGVLVSNAAVDFRQDANDDSPLPLGDAHWINSILQQNNSVYYEGTSVPQRMIFLGLTADAHTFTLKFNHEATKTQGGNVHHAYDFLTSWDQAVAAADEIDPNDHLMVNLFADQCGPEIGPPSPEMADACAALHAPPDNTYTATPLAPDDMQTGVGFSDDRGDVTARAAAYEALFDDRTVRIYSNGAITEASLALNTTDYPAAPDKPAGYSGTPGDLFAEYVLTWTQSATRFEVFSPGDVLFGTNGVVIEMGGHLAVGVDPLLAGIGYGPDTGSQAINGGPYHFKLSTLDGASLGSQDNQIKGADIRVANCMITCPGNQVCTCTCAATGCLVEWSPPEVIGGTFLGCYIDCEPGSGNFDCPITSPHTFDTTTTIQCRAENPDGLICTCEWQVIVEQDNTPPTVSCPADITVCNDLGQCGAVVTFAATCSDDCEDCTVACEPPSGSFFPVGTTIVTCTATDACGNTGTCTFTVTVNDCESPVPHCPDDITQCNDAGQCGAVVTFEATCSDNCGDCTVACVPPSGSFFPVGDTTVTCTATDTAGNTGTCTFTVTVNDCEPPLPICPDDITQCNDTGQCGAVVTFEATCSDNCGDCTVACEPPSGSFFPFGTTTVTCTAADAAGNTGSCTFTVTVDDCDPITCTADDGAAGTFSGTIAGGAAPYTCSAVATPENCGWVVDGYTVDGSTFTVTYHVDQPACRCADFIVTITDVCGRTTTCPKPICGPVCHDLPDAQVCDGSTAEFCADFEDGVPPFTYDWTGPGMPDPNDLDPNEPCCTVGAAGEYCVVVADGNGFQTESCCGTLFVDENPTSCVIEPNDPYYTQVPICAVPSPGAPEDYTYEWSSGQTTQCITPMVPDTYVCTVTDPNGCSSTCSADVVQNPFNGCTPGFWKQPQHFLVWPAPYTPNMLFSQVFEDAFPDLTLLQVLWLQGGGLEALGRHTVAALLNAADPDVTYPLEPQNVIDLFNAVFPGTAADYEALKDYFAVFNELGCPPHHALMAPATTPLAAPLR